MPEQVLWAAERHKSHERSKYQLASRLAQFILEDYPMIASRGEISYAEVFSFLGGEAWLWAVGKSPN